MLAVASNWNVPYLFKGAQILRDSSSSWNDGKRLKELLGEKRLSFRVGRRSDHFFGDRVQFEKDCTHVQATMQDFLTWTNRNIDQINENPLRDFSPEQYFAYADYMHLPEILDDVQDPLIKMIDWSDIGLKDRDGNQSTLWIGSQGSHTPCHYDTYGINFVAQITGRKRWLLFPPNTPLGELQTRIPYEESSVYIEVEPKLMKKYRSIDVFDVTLEPGDVLFVPKHWWHFVSSLDELTISVNSWLEQPDDHIERIKEMIVRQMITSTIIAEDSSCEQWFNHNEIFTDPTTNLTILSNLLNPNEDAEIKEPSAKRSCTDATMIIPVDHVKEQRLTSHPFGDLEFFSNIEQIHEETGVEGSNDVLKRLLKAMTHGEIVDLIYQKMRSIR